jgi:hypothetical protein
MESAIDFERRVWRVQRAGWVVLGMVAVAGLVGLFGSGPLARRESTSSQGGIRMRYDRFLHRQAPARVTVELTADSGGMARLWIDRSYLNDMTLERMTPEPESTWAGPDRSVFAFRAAPRGRGWVAVELEPQSFGPVQGSLGTGPDSISFRQFVYP